MAAKRAAVRITVPRVAHSVAQSVMSGAPSYEDACIAWRRDEDESESEPSLDGAEESAADDDSDEDARTDFEPSDEEGGDGETSRRGRRHRRHAGRRHVPYGGGIEFGVGGVAPMPPSADSLTRDGWGWAAGSTQSAPSGHTFVGVASWYATADAPQQCEAARYAAELAAAAIAARYSLTLDLDAEDAADAVALTPLVHEQVAYVLNAEWQRPYHESTLRALCGSAPACTGTSPFTRGPIVAVTRVCVRFKSRAAASLVSCKRPRLSSI